MSNCHLMTKIKLEVPEYEELNLHTELIYVNRKCELSSESTLSEPLLAST